MSDERIRELERRVALGGDLLAAELLARERERQKPFCTECNGSGTFVRQLEVKGILATRILIQTLPCTACRPVEWGTFRCPVFEKWCLRGRIEADMEEFDKLPPGPARDAIEDRLYDAIQYEYRADYRRKAHAEWLAQQRGRWSQVMGAPLGALTHER